MRKKNNNEFGQCFELSLLHVIPCLQNSNNLRINYIRIKLIIKEKKILTNFQKSMIFQMQMILLTKYEGKKFKIKEFIEKLCYAICGRTCKALYHILYLFASDTM